MTRPTPIAIPRTRAGLVRTMLAFATLLFSSAALAAPATLSDATPVGKLGGELIRRVNTGNPEQVRTWASTVLSAAIPASDKADFLKDLVSAARDSGGVDVIDVRSDPHMPGMLQVAIQAHRGGRRAVLVLAADPAHADQLAQAGMFPLDDPTLYAAWPKAAVSHEALKQLVDTTLDQMVRTSDFSGCVTVVDRNETVVDTCRGLAERRFGVRHRPARNQADGKRNRASHSRPTSCTDTIRHRYSPGKQ